MVEQKSSKLDFIDRFGGMIAEFRGFKAADREPASFAIDLQIGLKM